MNKRVREKGTQEETTREVWEEVAKALEDNMERLSCQGEEHVDKMTDKSDGGSSRPKRVIRRLVRYLD